jgi:hypothetical protein
MAIAVANGHNKQNHGNQPPIKKAAIFSTRRDKQTDERHNHQKRCEARRRSLLRDLPIRRKTFQPDSTRAKEMMGIISLSDLMRVPIPCDRG